MRRVVLTGSSGFVGTALMELLKRKQIDVFSIPQERLYGLERDELGTQELIGSLRKFQPDTFIHLAWKVEATSWAYAISQQPLIASTKMLLDILTEIGIEQTIGVGSCLEYYPSPTSIDEGWIENRELEYTRDKLDMKQVLVDHAKRNTYITSWARFFFLYGPNDRFERLIPSVAKKVESNLDILLENPHARVDYLNVGDAADALLILAQTRSSGVFNVGSGILITPREIVTKIICLTRSSSKIIELSKESQQLHGFVANTAKLRELNWAPRVSLDAGLTAFLGIM